MADASDDYSGPQLASAVAPVRGVLDRMACAIAKGRDDDLAFTDPALAGSHWGAHRDMYREDARNALNVLLAAGLEDDGESLLSGDREDVRHVILDAWKRAQDGCLDSPGNQPKPPCGGCVTAEMVKLLPRLVIRETS